MRAVPALCQDAPISCVWTVRPRPSVFWPSHPGWHENVTVQMGGRHGRNHRHWLKTRCEHGSKKNSRANETIFPCAILHLSISLESCLAGATLCIRQDFYWMELIFWILSGPSSLLIQKCIGPVVFLRRIHRGSLVPFPPPPASPVPSHWYRGTGHPEPHQTTVLKALRPPGALL